MKTTQLTDVKTMLIAQAEASHAQWPQYAGYWNTWQVAVVVRDIKSRGAVIARKGDRVLYDPASLGEVEGKVTAFFPNHYVAGGCNTMVNATVLGLQ